MQGRRALTCAWRDASFSTGCLHARCALVDTHLEGRLLLGHLLRDVGLHRSAPLVQLRLVLGELALAVLELVPRSLVGSSRLERHVQLVVQLAPPGGELGLTRGEVSF